MSDERLQQRPGPMPRTRGECEAGPRPCPWTECRYHLGPPNGLVESGYWSATGYRRLYAQRRSAETCSLDLADRGGMAPAEIADELGVSRQRVLQIIDSIALQLLDECAEELEAMREDLEEIEAMGCRPWEVHA